jgi:hypothetical protein
MKIDFGFEVNWLFVPFFFFRKLPRQESIA